MLESIRCLGLEISECFPGRSCRWYSESRDFPSAFRHCEWSDCVTQGVQNCDDLASFPRVPSRHREAACKTAIPENGCRRASVVHRSVSAAAVSTARFHLRSVTGSFRGRSADQWLHIPAYGNRSGACSLLRPCLGPDVKGSTPIAGDGKRRATQLPSTLAQHHELLPDSVFVAAAR